jgi:paraquat-inducible protein B
MRSRRHAAAIGAFVLGGLALVVAALVTWGSGRLFRETVKYVCYFDGSVEGLEVGAPVKVRGVTIGKVLRVQIRYRQAPDDDRIPVFIELDVKRLVGLGGARPDSDVMPALVARGLRARLESQSLVTGTLFVNFGIFADSPVRLSELAPAGGFPEVPTVPSRLTELSASVTAIVSNLERTDIAAMVQSIAEAAGSIERLAGNPKLPQALAELEATLNAYSKLGSHIDANVEPLLAELKLAVVDARKALVGLDGAAGATSRLVAPEAPLSVRLSDALGEVSRAADAVRELADYLQRNPNSLLVGKSR